MQKYHQHQQQVGSPGSLRLPVPRRRGSDPERSKIIHQSSLEPYRVPDMENTFRCPECNTLVRQAHNLAMHIKNKHAKTKLQCPYCSKQFKWQASMNRHIKDVHSQHQPPQYICTNNSSFSNSNM